MILKYKFGTPIETDAVITDLPCEKGVPTFGTITANGEGFRFEYTLAADEAVYGLGEAMRGINKRGGVYERAIIWTTLSIWRTFYPSMAHTISFCCPVKKQSGYSSIILRS